MICWWYFITFWNQCAKIIQQKPWEAYPACWQVLSPTRKKTISEACQGCARFQQYRETRAVIKFLFLQGKAKKEIDAVLTETLACFLPSRAKDLSASLYKDTVANTVARLGPDDQQNLPPLWRTKWPSALSEYAEITLVVFQLWTVIMQYSNTIFRQRIIL